MRLVSLDQAKDRLNVDFNDKDPDIWSMIAQASAILLKRIKKTDADIASEWGSPTVVPEDLQGITLEIVAELYKNPEASMADVLSPFVLLLIEGWRDPTLR